MPANSPSSGLKRPCKSTNGTKLPLSSFTKSGGISGVACFATMESSAPNVGAVCTIPVPSSVVTKSPEMTLKAFSGLSFGKA